MEYSAQNNSSSTFRIFLEIENSDIVIKDLDIDFEVYKNNKIEANKAVITVWNLDDTTLRSLAENTNAVNLFTSCGNNEPVLLFNGYIEQGSMMKYSNAQGQNSVKNFFTTSLEGKKHFDVPVVIVLIDGKPAYTEKEINKNYRQSVSSTQIIKDCIDVMGIGISRFSENLPEKQYKTFKAVGKPHLVLQKVCKPLGISFSIQNGLACLISPYEKSGEEPVISLNISNSKKPQSYGGNETGILTGFIPYINPNDYVQCEFEEFEGIERVKEVYAKGNNYGKAGETLICI